MAVVVLQTFFNREDDMYYMCEIVMEMMIAKCPRKADCKKGELLKKLKATVHFPLVHPPPSPAATSRAVHQFRAHRLPPPLHSPTPRRRPLGANGVLASAAARGGGGGGGGAPLTVCRRIPTVRSTPLCAPLCPRAAPPRPLHALPSASGSYRAHCAAARPYPCAAYVHTRRAPPQRSADAPHSGGARSQLGRSECQKPTKLNLNDVSKHCRSHPLCIGSQRAPSTRLLGEVRGGGGGISVIISEREGGGVGREGDGRGGARPAGPGGGRARSRPPHAASVTRQPHCPSDTWWQGLPASRVARRSPTRAAAPVTVLVDG
ncbi:Protein of unknown function [Gryllus bimaculatus]|nr:Protein of unknown function [Gryllus bimaculatus]